MATVHKIEVFFNGPTIYAMQGERMDVQGLPMVRMSHGTIVKPEGFRTSLADAKRAAADKIAYHASEMAGRAAALRAEADAMDAREACGI